jgi:hypothetical protein
MIAPMQFMKHHTFTIPTLACTFVLAGVSSLAAGLTGAIFTTNSTGTVVNGNQYDITCSVYLNGGPGPNAPAHAAGLPDGDYYFQVTDPSGRTLLSTDPVSNRRFRVIGGVITAYTGTGGPVHPTGIDQDHPELGATTIALANMSCPADFLASPNNGGAYKVWVTPVTSFIGDASKVDFNCSNGCFHGFLPSASKTDNFKVNNAPATFCLTVNKLDGSSRPVAHWQFSVTDNAVGAGDIHHTDSTGTITVCGLVSGTYTVSEADAVSDTGSIVIGLTVNNVPVVPATTSTSFSWAAGQPMPVIVFQNCLVGGFCPPPQPPPA